MLRIALSHVIKRVKCLHALHSLETQTETPYGTNSNEEKKSNFDFDNEKKNIMRYSQNQK